MLRREADWRKTVREEWILEGSERKGSQGTGGGWPWFAWVYYVRQSQGEERHASGSVPAESVT